MDGFKERNSIIILGIWSVWEKEWEGRNDEIIISE